MQIYDIELNKDFGKVLRKMADEVNISTAEKIVNEAFEYIVKQCVTQARLGQYELKINPSSREYAKLYNNTGNECKYIEEILSSRLKDVGIKLKAGNDGTFCEPYYIASFEKVEGKEE